MNQEFSPDFIGIGVERSGTTWIFNCLREHPQICCSKYKEVNFFNSKSRFNTKNDKYQKGLPYYRRYFSHCPNNKIKGEFSPLYFLERKAAKRIKQHFPRVKLILSLRNPIERAYSYYLYDKSRGKVPKGLTFEKAIREKFAFYIQDGFYFENLKYYLSLFPKQNILILVYEDIQKDPITFIQEIYKFLKVDENFRPGKADRYIHTPQNKNDWQLFFSSLIHKGKHSLYQTGFGRRILGKLEIMGFGNFLFSALEKKDNFSKKEKPPLKEKTRSYLQKLYREDIRKLEELTGKNLSSWQ